jgi:hypothetical protein
VTAGAVATEKMAEPESAELEFSQQKRQAQAVISLATAHCVTVLLLLASLMHCSTVWTNLTKILAPSYPVTLPAVKEEIKEKQEQDPALRPWWGSHQHSWNPTKDRS